MPEEIIRETISVTRTSVSPEDKEISATYNDLVRAAMREARRMLRMGSPETKLRIVLAAMSSAARLAALDTRSEVEEQRYAFERLVSDVTSIPELSHLVTENEIIDVTATTVVQPAYHQDNVKRLPRA